MSDLIQQIVTILRAMWKYRWFGLVAAWVVGVVGAGIVLRVPDKFEANARVFVDTQSILKPLMTGLTVQPNIDQQVVMLSRTLITRPNMEKLVRMADLDAGETSKQQKDALIDNLMRTLEIKTMAGRENIYGLGYRDTDPERAKRVVQSLVSIFVESSLGNSRKDSDTAKRFIDEQISIYEKKLEEAESRLKEFKLKNIAINLEDGKNNIGRMSSYGEQVNRAKLELREAEMARDALRRQILGDGKSMGSAEVALPEMDSRIDTQKKNLDNLLQKYTELHPDVIGTRRIIKELEAQKKEEIEALRKAAAANPDALVGSANNELKRSIATAEANVASLKARVAEYESRFNQLRHLVQNEPEMEAELAQLNRDYAVHKKQYEDLVSRRESASLSGELESVAGVADFRVIDPPSVSSKPVAPNRMILLPMALVAALGIGLAVCFLASQIRPVFTDTKTLREVTELPLLGSVSLVAGHKNRIRESAEFKRFVAALAALIGLYMVGMVVLYMISR